MTLILDSAPLVAVADPREPKRDAILDLLRAESGPLVVPAPVTAEVDYLLGRRHGARARRAFLADLAAGRFVTACLEREDHAAVVGLESRHEGLDLGLCDCAIVVAAERYETERVLTFDERHFRAIHSLRGLPFTVLPADG